MRIKVDREHYEVFADPMRGWDLRNLVTPPIPETHDLWKIVPGDHDILVSDDDLVEIQPNLRFFSCPKIIGAA